jgi:serum/glucocorticoid-regulated kinase 2
MMLPLILSIRIYIHIHSHIIALDTINDIRLSRGLWFQEEKLLYIEISYLNEHIYLCMRSKSAARQWYEALRNCVGYVKYVSGKIETYLHVNPRKAQKNIV